MTIPLLRSSFLHLFVMTPSSGALTQWDADVERRDERRETRSDTFITSSHPSSVPPFCPGRPYPQVNL